MLQLYLPLNNFQAIQYRIAQKFCGSLILQKYLNENFLHAACVERIRKNILTKSHQKFSAIRYITNNLNQRHSISCSSNFHLYLLQLYFYLMTPSESSVSQFLSKMTRLWRMGKKQHCLFHLSRHSWQNLTQILMPLLKCWTMTVCVCMYMCAFVPIRLVHIQSHELIKPPSVNRENFKCVI